MAVLTLAVAAAACGSGSGDGAATVEVPFGSAPTRPPATRTPSPPLATPTIPPSVTEPATAACGSGGGGIGAVQRSGQRSFSAPPARVIDPEKAYVAKMQTDKGLITLLLAAKDMPDTVNNFVFLACNGYYDGLTFHRVERTPPFVIQGGDPLANGMGGPGYNIKRELSPAWKHDTGVLAMARSQAPDSAGSQFYITLAPQPGLDNQYAVFGRVLSGMDVVNQIAVGDKILRVDIEQH